MTELRAILRSCGSIKTTDFSADHLTGVNVYFKKRII